MAMLSPTSEGALPMTHQRGFTLTELLTTTCIAAVLVTQALPAMQTLQNNSRRAATGNTLMASLSLARAEALRSGMDTVICPANASGTGCRNDGRWDHGWLAFTDRNRNGVVDGSDRVFLHEAATSGVTIISGSSRPRVRFAANGMNRGSNLTIRICIDGVVQSAVVLNNAGRGRIEQQRSALRSLRCD